MTTAADHIDPAVRAEALASLLIERGLVDQATMDNFIKTYEQSVGPMNGAKVVARAWTDPGYAGRLLADGTAAIAELGFKGPQGEHIVVLREHPRGPPRGGVHALLVLPVAGARAAAVLVQGPVLPVPHRP